MPALGSRHASQLPFSAVCVLMDHVHSMKSMKARRARVEAFIRHHIGDGAPDAFQLIRLLLPKV